MQRVRVERNAKGNAVPQGRHKDCTSGLESRSQEVGESEAWQTPRLGLEDRTLKQMEACLWESFAARMNPEAWEVMKEEGGGCFPLRLKKDALGLLWRVVWVRRKLLIKENREEYRERERRSNVEQRWSQWARLVRLT